MSTYKLDYFKTARELFDFLEKDKDFNIKIPVDINEIVKLLGIQIEYIYNVDNKFIASIKHYANFIVITINKFGNNYEPQRRFSIAHLIGHYCKHSDFFEDTKKTIDSVASFWDIPESEANAFARQLLMPTDLIVKEGVTLIEKHGKMDQSVFIFEMSGKFQVPTNEMQIRLKNIGVIE